MATNTTSGTSAPPAVRAGGLGQSHTTPARRGEEPLDTHRPDHEGGIAAVTVDQPQAEKVSGLSSKTLGRLAGRGERVGRMKVGRRVLYHLPTLTAWLATHAGVGNSP